MIITLVNRCAEIKRNSPQNKLRYFIILFLKCSSIKPSSNDARTSPVKHGIDFKCHFSDNNVINMLNLDFNFSTALIWLQFNMPFHKIYKVKKV